VHVVGTVIAHIAKTAMYAPPGIGKQSLRASSLQSAGSHGWRLFQPWAFLSYRPTVNSNRLTVATALQPSTTQLAQWDGRDKFGSLGPDPTLIAKVRLTDIRNSRLPAH